MATPDLRTRYLHTSPLTATATATAIAVVAVVAFSGVFGFSAQAATADQQTDEIAHIVKEGDTLEGLARSYLAAPRQ